MPASVSKAAVLVAVTILALLCSAPTQASFPGANGWIAFADHDQSTGCFTLQVFRLDGSAVHDLGPRCLSKQAPHPRWSPDGRRLLYASGPGRATIMSAAGRRERTLAIPGFADWTADGQHLIYEQPRRNQMVIMRRSLRGGRARLVAPGAGPMMSPNGKLIAYVPPSLWDPPLALMNAHTGVLLRIVDPVARAFDFSPDSRNLIYVKSSSASPECAARLLIAPVDGRLTRPLDVPLGCNVRAAGVVLSPDGTQIALIGTTDPGDGPTSAVYVGSARTGVVHLVHVGRKQNVDEPLIATIAWQPRPRNRAARERRNAPDSRAFRK